MLDLTGHEPISSGPGALEMYEALAGDMEKVRELFAGELLSDLPLVNERIEQVGKYRGKMLRPGLVLLCGRACGSISRVHHLAAAVVEMVHMAALIHDDVLDQAQTRRRGATLNELYGNETAILAGDFLLSHAFGLSRQLDSQRLWGIIAATTNMVCEGEIMQVAHKRDFQLREEEYLQIISRKTASLCGASCRLGAECSGQSGATARALDDYGCALGMAFQITDDVLDLVGSEKVMGKTLGRDFLQGKLTLPLIRAREALCASGHGEFMELLRLGQQEDLERICTMVHECGAMDSAMATAGEYVDRAIGEVEVLAAGPEREALEKMAQFVVDRQV